MVFEDVVVTVTCDHSKYLHAGDRSDNDRLKEQVQTV